MEEPKTVPKAFLPLSLFIVVKTPKEDRMLYMYPPLESEKKTNERMGVYLFCSKTSIKDGKLFGFDDEILAFLFTVLPKMCDQRMHIKINDVRFIGYPVLLNSLNTECEDEELPDILLYNVIFAIQATAPKNVVDSYANFVEKISKGIKQDELKSKYLSNQMEIILQCQDVSKWQNQYVFAVTEEYIWQKSTLAFTLRNIFVDLTKHGCTSLRFNGWLDIGCQLLESSTVTTKEPMFSLHTTLSQGTILIKPYHAMILLENSHIVMDNMFPNAAGALCHFLRVASPLKNLQAIGQELQMDLSLIFRFAEHLVYWGKARMVYPIAQNNTYIVSRTADLTNEHMQRRFAFQFRINLAVMLSRFSSPLTVRDYLRPEDGFKDDGNRTKVAILVWLLRHRLIVQLHTYVYLNVDWIPQEEDLDESVLNDLSQETVSSLLNFIPRHAILFIIKNKECKIRIDTFAKIAPFLDGEHHLEDIMYYNGLTRIFLIETEKMEVEMSRIHAIEKFINERLKPDLREQQEKHQKILDDICEYELLLQSIAVIKSLRPLKKLKMKVNLGLGFFAQAVVNDPNHIFIDVGCGTYVEFTLDEADVVINERLELLKMLSKKQLAVIGSIKAHISLLVYVEVALFFTFIKMVELLLDPSIRTWVFVPIVLFTFLIGVVRHYLAILIHTKKEIGLQQIQDSHALVRSRLLRENGRYLSKHSFLMRKQFFNDEESGYFKVAQQRQSPVVNPMSDPSVMTDMLKGNLLNVIPMLVIGGWINWTFSGFVTTKVPFPLTLRFKPMLQHGIALASLDASWVSSASWYFLNVFGLRSMYALILGEDNAADQARLMQEQVTMSANTVPHDPRQAFKAEWEALQICSHNWMSKCEGKVLESTLALIKSNALHLAEEIEKEIIQRDLAIAKKKIVRLNEEQCIDFYMDMARSASFDQVVRQLSSGEAIAMVLEGRRAIGTWKNIIQKLDNAPFENYHQLHVDKECLHASDDYFKARREIQFIFPEVQLVPWNEEVQHYLQEEVIPTMSRALEELARTNPIDPLKWLASWLWRHDPQRGESTIADDY
ncbi:ER membrane protein complex subunit 3 [Trichinella papuae]|uniref:GATOR complex protein NPRL3 n=1 Tax=Trichinella papuae TaxID=268474 RepID=A0A0V1N514_9BILA|nr:ER membrane protein complex subunit 3 [Trichinella papuae]